MIKIGDRIKILVNSPNGAQACEGDLGTVVLLSNNSNVFEYQLDKNLSRWWSMKSGEGTTFKVVKENKLKQGDYVMVYDSRLKNGKSSGWLDNTPGGGEFEYKGYENPSLVKVVGVMCKDMGAEIVVYTKQVRKLKKQKQLA